MQSSKISQINHQLLNPLIKQQDDKQLILISNNNTGMINQGNTNTRKDVNNDKTLMRLENPIYQLKKKDQSEHEYVIRKMMNRTEPKPKIQFVQRSPLLKELAAMMPIFKKANEQLKTKVIEESEKIDAKLEMVEDSSSSSEQDNNDPQNAQVAEEGERKIMKIKNIKSEMVDQSQQSKDTANPNQIELNFLRYEIPEQLQPIEVKPEPVEQVVQKPQKKLIQEV